MTAILGISLGTRLIGMALVYDGELSQCRVRTFAGAWDEMKYKAIIAVILKKVDRHGVTALAIKTSDPEFHTASIKKLLRSLKRMCRRRNITLSVFTIKDLRDYDSKTGRKNSKGLINTLLRRYPTHTLLHALYAKEKSNKAPYHTKLFEAIACAELAKRTEH